MIRNIVVASSFVVACAAAAPAAARDYRAGDVTVVDAYALATPPGATTGAAYLSKLVNGGRAADTLVGATSPAADRVEIHTMKMDGDVMRMRDVGAVPLAPSATVAMTPGLGYHLMLVGLHGPLAAGRDVPMTLRFEHAGAVDVVLPVRDRPAEPMMHHMGH